MQCEGLGRSLLIPSAPLAGNEGLGARVGGLGKEGQGVEQLCRTVEEWIIG